MSPSKTKPPTADEIAKRADRLRSVTGPMSAAALVEQMPAARSSQAMNPRQFMCQRLREAVGRLLVFVDADRVHALRQFVIILTADKISSGSRQTRIWATGR